MRGPVLGRRNFGGCRSLRGLEVAGLLYSLIESAKLVGLDRRLYLRADAEAALRGDAPLLRTFAGHSYVPVADRVNPS